MATIDEEVATLRRIPMFARIDPRKLKMLALVCERVRFAPGQLLFRQGDDGDAAYLVIAGSAEIITDGPNGELVIGIAGRNALIGELAIVCDIPRTATIRAREALDTLRISREHFLLLVRDSADVAIEVMKVIGLRLAERTAEITALRAKIDGK